MVKIRLFISTLIILLFSFAAFTAQAHVGGLSPKDGCHNDNKKGERHYPGTKIPEGLCIDGIQIPWAVVDELTTIKVKEVERIIDPSPELWQRVNTAEAERNSAVHEKITAVNQSRADRQAARLANQDANASKRKMLQYESRMQDMEIGAPPCKSERAHGRYIILDDPFGDNKETRALKAVLDCLDIGE